MNKAMQPHSHDIDQFSVQMLRLFDVLYTTRSVTRTGEQLILSQSTVSSSLARLRNMLCDPLFVRTLGGMQPTPYAERLIGPCRIALSAIDTLLSEQAEFDPETTHRTFRISMTDASHVTLLPRLVARVGSEAPHVLIETLRITSQTPSQLIDGGTDLVLGLLPPLEAGFFQQKLYTQDWVCLARKGHPATANGLTQDAYRQAEHLGIDSGASRRVLEQALEAAGIERRVRLGLPGFLGASAIVLHTDMIVTLPRMIGERLARGDNLDVFDCPVPVPSFDFRQYWHERCHHDAAHRWLRSICAGLFQHASEST
jgi:DNA-binding transcriptional LysR family regulator